MTDHPAAGPGLEELALRLQEAEHGRIIRYVQVQAADDPYQHGQRWPKPFSNAFEDCQHPDCVLARTSSARLRAALREPPPQELPESLAASIALFKEDPKAWWEEWQRRHDFKVRLITENEQLRAALRELPPQREPYRVSVSMLRAAVGMLNACAEHLEPLAVGYGAEQMRSIARELKALADLVPSGSVMTASALREPPEAQDLGPDPECKQCHGSGECSNAQFRCPCRWRKVGRS